MLKLICVGRKSLSLDHPGDVKNMLNIAVVGVMKGMGNAKFWPYVLSHSLANLQQAQSLEEPPLCWRSTSGSRERS